MIDEEVRRIIDEQYAIALRILIDNRNLLEGAAGTLLEQEVIDGDDLDDIYKAVNKNQSGSAGTGPTQADRSLAA